MKVALYYVVKCKIKIRVYLSELIQSNVLNLQMQSSNVVTHTYAQTHTHAHNDDKGFSTNLYTSYVQNGIAFYTELQ